MEPQSSFSRLLSGVDGPLICRASERLGIGDCNTYGAEVVAWGGEGMVNTETGVAVGGAGVDAEAGVAFSGAGALMLLLGSLGHRHSN
jgi:hypothetical protein